MARISTKLVRLKRKLAIAEARENYKKETLLAAAASNTVTPYEGRGILSTFYVPSFKDNEVCVQVSFPSRSLILILGGTDQAALDKIGCFKNLPANKSPVQQKGYADNYYSIRVIYKANRGTAKITPWGSRTITYTRKEEGQSHRELPIGGDNFKKINLLWRTLQTAVPNPPLDLELLRPAGTVLDKVKITK
ncbi:MAG: hypothetical protein F6K22_31345 [Okeania sp. SIO2F4]|uniref:hypothetical protein n=1 Tax=Okeania sp. SIO2F4 TaxID=2607790 RepID=UPI00142B91DE|nr:hypothetical protein [Okeania sp. SIO2F4]NES06915.1 hypothetical protein [Okeania sp. SIO2F4]